MTFEYSVVPAPKKGVKAKGARSTEDRFANALQVIMNEKGAEGWEYVRTDTLPSEERQGFTGRTTVFQNMMVFRRTIAPVEAAPTAPTALLEAPAVPTPVNDDATDALIATRSQSKMMGLDTKPLDTDPARPEPKLSAD